MTRSWFAFLLALSAAAPAVAGEVTVGARTEVIYDSNVFGVQDDPVAEGEVLIAPVIDISERFASVEGSVHFKPTYELFFDQSELRGLNYDLTGTLAWRPTRATTITLQDAFLRHRNLRLLTSAEPGGGTTVEGGGRDRVFRNQAALVATHRVSARSSLQLNGSFGLWNFKRRVDQDSYNAGAKYSYTLRNNLSIGSGASFARTQIDSANAEPVRKTDYFNLSLNAEYVPAPTFLVHVSGGPTYVRNPKFREPSSLRIQLLDLNSDGYEVGLIPSTCPTIPSTGEFYAHPDCNYGRLPIVPNARLLEAIPFLGSVPDSDGITYFADVGVKRTWENAMLEAVYTRDAGSGSALGFSSVDDTVELRGNYRPWREISFVMALAWENRKEDAVSLVRVLDTLPGAPGIPAVNNLVPVGFRAVSGGAFADSVATYSAYLSARYLISRRTRLDAYFTWRDQSATETSQFNDYERFQISLGLTIELEPARW